MDEEGGPAIDAGAQHTQAFVGGVPGLHHDVVQFVAEEVFYDTLVAWLDFKEIGEYTDGREAAVHHAGLKEAADGFGRVSVLGDDRFERPLFAKGSREFRAENVEVGLGARLLQLFLFDQAAELADFFGDAGDALGDTFKFESELSALSAEGFDLD